MTTNRPPLNQTLFYILLVLVDEPLHGSGIAREVRMRSDDKIRLWPVALYRTLDEMSDSGLIEELAGAAHPDGASRRRRYYRITPDGRMALRREAERLAGLAAVALTAVGLGEGGP